MDYWSIGDLRLESWSGEIGEVGEVDQESGNERELPETIQASDDHHDAVVLRCKKVIDTILPHTAPHNILQPIPFSIHNFEKVDRSTSTQDVADFDFEIVLRISSTNISSCVSLYSDLLNTFHDILSKNSEQLGIEPSVTIFSSMSEEHVIRFRFLDNDGTRVNLPAWSPRRFLFKSPVNKRVVWDNKKMA